ncbi:hypothetical protein QEN19_001870 [Hanseniaspora menglaensis]
MNLDKITKKISSLGLHDIKNAARFTQNLIIQYEPYQVDIRRATNTDEWGPLQKHFLKIIRHRHQVPMYLITEYTLKRLVDHMANDAKNLYEKARKDYVNYGLEYRVVFKCLIVIEWLILNCPTTRDVVDVMKCLKKHAIIFNEKVPAYKVLVAGDGKMEVHTRIIHNKNDSIKLLISDKDFLKQERLKHKKQQEQLAKSGSISSAGDSSSASASSKDVYGSYDDDDVYYGSSGKSSSPEDLDSDDYYIESNSSKKTSARSASIVDRQRSQRRQILREQIRIQEERRKKLEDEQKQTDVIDLLNFDDVPKKNVSAVQESSSKTSFDNVWNNESKDDEFGDFQTEQPTVASSINIFADEPKSQNNNASAVSKPKSSDPFGDLLDLI